MVFTQNVGPDPGGINKLSRLQDQVIVVTGAGRGIGRAHAEFLASQGAMVVVNDTGGDVTGTGGGANTAGEVVDAIVSTGGSATADTHDVQDEADGVIATAIEVYGRVDGIVNNAGIVSFGGVEVLTDEQARRMLGVHVLGMLGTIRAAWPYMRAQGHGRIVNTSSVAVFGVGDAPLYPMAKAALVGLTRSLAIDGAPFGIRVNCIMPMGYSRMAETQAGLGDFLKRKFPPELISPFVGALLVSDSPCNGEMFAVGGGRAARVFLGTVPGAIGTGSIDDWLGRFDDVMNLEGFVTPPTMEAEIGFEYQHLGINLNELGIDLLSLGTAVSEAAPIAH